MSVTHEVRGEKGEQGTLIRRKRLVRQPSKDRSPCSIQSSISTNCMEDEKGG